MADLVCQVCLENIMPVERIRMSLCSPESHYLHRDCWLQMPLAQRERCLTCRQREVTPQVLAVIETSLESFPSLVRIRSFGQAPQQAQLLMREWQLGNIRMDVLQDRAARQHRGRLRNEVMLHYEALTIMMREFQTVLAQGSTGPVRRARLQTAMARFNHYDLYRALDEEHDLLTSYAHNTSAADNHFLARSRRLSTLRDEEHAHAIEYIELESESSESDEDL